jgi:ABC-type multidrug transport system ATPase subunit
MGNKIIELKDVSFSTQETEVLKTVSYAYDEGKTTALIGPSGSGKSMMLKLSAGLLLPSKGNVFFKGLDIANMNRAQNLAFRKESAMVFQDSALWVNQTIYQILELPLRIHFPKQTKQERDIRIKEVLSQVGYKRDLHIRPASLSMGEQKLIAFARALLCSPSVLFLDEWTESLDDAAAQRLIGIVQQLKEKNHTILFVSHDLGIIKNLADYVLLIANGKLTLSLTREQITEDNSIAKIIEKEIAS